MAAERFFTKVAQDVLDATERFANHLDDNFNQLFGGLRSGNGTTNGRDYSANDYDTVRSTEKDYDTIHDHEDRMMDNANPLQGMADHVLSGIMDGQVGISSCCIKLWLIDVASFID
jgi:hypothetical protein